MARTPVPFAGTIAKPEKRSTGRGGVSDTPLHVRTTGAAVDASLQEHVRTKLGRRLGKFAEAIERVSVRFDDVNGPRGGVDTVARVKVVLSARPSIVVESHGVDARHAFDLASHRTERTLRSSLGRAGVAHGRRKPAATPPAGAATSKTGVSATDRKAGGGSTAARNVKRTTSRATAALEDSATGTPSRKSTRASANRTPSGSKQRRRATAKASSPQRRAARASTGR